MSIGPGSSGPTSSRWPRSSAPRNTTPFPAAIILDHAAAGAPLADLTRPTPDGRLVLEPVDLAGAEEALGRGGPAAAPIAGGAPSPAEVVTIEPTANGRPRTLAEVVDHEALAYRAWGTPTGDFLAAQMERVAQLIRWTGATTPRTTKTAWRSGIGRSETTPSTAVTTPRRSLLPSLDRPPGRSPLRPTAASCRRRGRAASCGPGGRGGPPEASYHRSAGIVPAAGDVIHDER